MAIIANSIIDKVAGALLNDRSKVRFRQADLLAFLNEASRFIAGINPTASSQLVPFTCVQGSRQTVPATAHSFLGAAYNLASDGTTPGRAIEPTSREALDIPDPNWRTRTAKTEVRHIVASDKLPTIFDVYPPVVAGTKIAVKLAIIPTDVLGTDPILLEDTYEPAIMNYMLSRAYQKNAEYAGNPERATAYYQAVLNHLGIKAQSDVAAGAETEGKAV